MREDRHCLRLVRHCIWGMLIMPTHVRRFLTAGQYRTIYPYHKLNISLDKVSTDSAIIYTHLQSESV